jgi:excisionase family DNA binding protein
MNALLTIEDVATKLNVSRDTVRRRIADGSLPVVRIGDASRRRPVRIDAAVLAERLRHWSDAEAVSA